jgi:hypothetical protein
MHTAHSRRAAHAHTRSGTQPQRLHACVHHLPNKAISKRERIERAFRGAPCGTGALDRRCRCREYTHVARSALATRLPSASSSSSPVLVADVVGDGSLGPRPGRGLTLWLKGLRGGCSVRTAFPTTKVTLAACHDSYTPRLARTSAGAPVVQGPLEWGSWGCNAARGRCSGQLRST